MMSLSWKLEDGNDHVLKMAQVSIVIRRSG